jgi:4,5-dihydroxyphthalate decarboxylase
VVLGEPEDLFARALRHREFDVAELSLSSYLVIASRGDPAYVGVPVFPSRAFRHSGIYIRTDRGIERPEDLAGRVLGVPEFQMTAAIWVRGILADHHGVPPSQIRWRTGGLEVAGGKERIDVEVRPEIEVEAIPADRTLSGMFAEGELDGLVSPRVPSCVAERRPGVARMFPDYRAAEQAFYRETRLFPIMHLVAVRRELAERHPWLPASVFAAFAEAKQMAIADLHKINFLRVTAPWIVPDLDDVRALMGDDFWPYGLEPNAKELAAVARWSHEEGLAARLLEPHDLFHPSTLLLTG